MDVRQSLNTEDNLHVICGDGEMSYLEGDSFYAKAPPMAASTVGRTKARITLLFIHIQGMSFFNSRRKMKAEEEMGSFLDETPVTIPRSSEDGNQNVYAGGARPKTFNFQCPDEGDQSLDTENGTDWSVVNDWCRENKPDPDMSDQDGKSSLGIINIDDIDPSPNNFLLDSAIDRQFFRNTTKDSTPLDLQGSSSNQSSVKELVSMDTPQVSHEGSTDSNPFKHDGSSSSHDSKPEHLLARSHLGTVKKASKDPSQKEPMVAAMRQMLFGQSAIGEENEGDESIYNVELEEDDLKELDADFEIDCSAAGESDSEKSPEKTPTNKTEAVSASASRFGDEMPLDSVYFRPGTTGEEHTHPQLTYLSKVSLFDGGSGSEIDTEDELELVRKAQGERKEAAGEDSNTGQNTRPGLEGLSLTDESSRQLPITQRQSAEGNVVTSPVPGDGGGGGDGSSGPDSEDDNTNVISQGLSSTADQQEQRIRPMGDDLLSDLRFSRYATASTQSEVDLRLSSRYLTPGSAMDESNQPSFNIDEFLDQDFDPGNRLEASGFNADDVSAVNNKGSNPFDNKSSSFGSFGLNMTDGGPGGDGGSNNSMFSVEMIETVPGNHDNIPTDNEVIWAELEGSIGTSQGSKGSSLDHQTSLGRRSAASGSPSLDRRTHTGSIQSASDRSASTTQDTFTSPRDVIQPDKWPDSGGQPTISDNDLFRKPSMPAPKAAKFSQSIAKSKLSTSRSGSTHSVKSSGGSSAKSYESESIDLELRTSLTGQAKEQALGLRRVPSCGGTSVMDLTVNDDEFFDQADAKAMLDADEVVFEEENVFRQDDAMAETGSPNDSWACRSIMTLARPSWLDDTSQEEEVFVRISVGTFMRGRTEALGSLSGHGDEPRPDFGMKVESPPKAIVRPSRLIDESQNDNSKGDVDVGESTRTCGVGEYDSSPVRMKNEKDEDRTLHMDSLLKTPGAESSFSVSRVLQLRDLDDKPSSSESAFITPSDVSMFMEASDISLNTLSSRLQNLKSSKVRSKPGLAQPSTSSTYKPGYSQASIASIYKSGASTASITRPAGLSQGSTTSAAPSSVYTVSSPQSRSVFQKPSQLPTYRGSNVSRSFPKVAEPDKSLLKQDMKSKDMSDVLDAMKKSDSVLDSTRDNESLNETPKSMTRKSDQSEISDDVWSSPNTSSSLPSKLDNFKFSMNIAEEFQKKFKNLTSGSTTGQGDSLVYDDFSKKDRERTPPPDGHSYKEKPKTVIDKGLTPQLSRKYNENRLSNDGKLCDTKSVISNKPDIIPGQSLTRTSPIRDKILLETDLERSRLDTSAVDHGYMPGHHIPDGTEYSQRSDYAHINHKGELREDVAGMDDVGLAESRGFDILRKKGAGASDNSQEVDDSKRKKFSDCSSASQNTSSVKQLGNKDQNSSRKLSNDNRDDTLTSNHGNQDLHSVDTQTDINTDKLESWTQTSFVLNENTEKQSESILSKAPDFTLDEGSHVNISGIPPKHPLISFKHNLLPKHLSAVSDKPHLLTKQSLMQTDFAQDNLRRDYSDEVMDRIYSRSSVGGQFHTMNATSGDSNYIPSNRESLESQREWQMMQGRETMDTILDGDFPGQFDIYRDSAAFMRLASAQSTPYPPEGSAFSHLTDHHSNKASMFSKTSVYPNTTHHLSDISSGPLSKTGVNQIKTEPDKLQGCMSLSPVEAPGILKFKEVCCVGISRKEILPLHNPTDRWMECTIQVNSLELNGRQLPLDWFPFTIRREKIIIDQKKTESIDVMFLPKFAGAYIAQLQIFSKSFEKKNDRHKEVIPVNVALQAISEEPKIAVYEKDCDEDNNKQTVNFGGVVWGTCREKTICIRNMGLSTVPLRLALISNQGWHCFSFEPEGRESDVSIISGSTLPSSSSHGRGIINITLTGSNQPFNYHEVKVWCKPPEKKCTKALCKQPAEELSCKMDVEIDIPSTKFPKLSSLCVRASVGVQKLHIQSNLKELRLTCAPNRVYETHFKVFNAGNLPLDASFGFTAHKNVFSVYPTTLSLNPDVDGELTVAFKPREETPSRLACLLLMYVQPDGPMFELAIQGEVKEQTKDRIKLFCDQTKINFGGIPLGKTCVKKFSLMNKGPQPLNMCAMVRADNILIARSPDPRTVGCKSLDLTIPGNERDTINVYVLYTPVVTSKDVGKVVLKQVPMESSLKFSVQVGGYGGVSRLCCSEESSSPATVKGFPCITIQSFSLGMIKEMFVHNLGERGACVKVSVFKDLECTLPMLSGHVVVQPSEFKIGIDVRQKLEIVVSMTESEFISHSDKYGVGGVLCLSYQDQVESEKPYRSRLVVGLIKRSHSDRDPFSATTTPSVSTRHRKFVLPSVDDNNDINNIQTQSYSQRTDIVSRQPENIPANILDDWDIEPSDLTIYYSNIWPNSVLGKFCLKNLSDKTRRFMMIWPGSVLSVTPAEGIMNPRENMWIKIYPISHFAQSLDINTWSGEVIVMSEGDRKVLKVKLLRDETVPQNDLNSVPSVMRSPRSAVTGTGSNRLGSLHISRTMIEFDSTKAGKLTEETLQLSNLSDQNIRWTFSSFASPYHKEKGDNSRNMSRKSYKVFEFSQQFGKLGHNASVKLTLKFMPRTPGTYMQYWDLKKLDYEKSENNSSQDYIRLHLTGECLENLEERRARPALTEMDNLLPSLSNKGTVRLAQDVVKFPKIAPNQEVTTKVELRNSDWADAQVKLYEPSPPFFVKHTKFTIEKKKYVRFPIQFKPSRAGKYSEILHFEGQKGEKFSLKINGECC
ncbi:hypothetical protein ACF0H5_009811 [Mactra antiquata]